MLVSGFDTRSTLAMLYGPDNWRLAASRSLGVTQNTLRSLANGNRPLTLRHKAIIRNVVEMAPRRFAKRLQRDLELAHQRYRERMEQVAHLRNRHTPTWPA
jgi:plasmid maintenance system antidote protein VapI